MKTCSRCKCELIDASFGIDRQRADGLNPRCKPCAAAYALRYQMPPASKPTNLVQANLVPKWVEGAENYSTLNDRTHYRNKGHPELKSFGNLT